MPATNISPIQKIEIPQSRKKAVLLLLGCLLFVVAGFYILKTPKLYIGIASIAFFGLGVIVAIIKLLDKRKGVIIDSKGITDNTTFISVGLIEWEDIIELRPMFVVSEFFVLVEVSDPEKYISKTNNKIKIFLMGRKLKKYNSPISIANSTLKCKNEVLYNLMQTALEQYKETKK